MIPVTVIILTHDEAINIARCIDCLRAFDEIIVVDSGSTDGTLEILAKDYSNVRVLHHPFEDFGAQRNWALDESNPRHEWVLFVDADEFMEEPLALEISAFVAQPDEAMGAYIAGRTYFLGRWLKYSTFFPSYQLRLLKLGRVRYRKEGHGQREVTDGPLVYLKHSWRHEAFSHGVQQWIDRHNRYSTDEVALIKQLQRDKIVWNHVIGLDPVNRRRALKCLLAKLPGRPVLKFFYGYVLRSGWLDGRAGLYFNLLRCAHEMHVVAKLADSKYRSLDAGYKSNGR